MEEYYITNIPKKEFVKLAEAITDDVKYLNEIDDFIRSNAKKHGYDTDFLGLTYYGGKLVDAVNDVLGYDFSYFLYEAESNFDKFNKMITPSPNVHNFEEMWDWIQSQKS